MKNVFTLLLFIIGCKINAQVWKPMESFGGNINTSLNTDSGILIGTDAGIYITQNDGVGFQPWTTDIPSGPIIDLHWVSNSSVLLAVIMDKGIYRSTDIGKTWTLSLAGRFLRLGSFGSSYILQAGNGIVIRSSSVDSLYISTNAGASWEARYIKNQSFNDVYTDGYHLFSPSNKTLGDSTGFYRSDDLGKTWVLSNKGLYGYWGAILNFKGKLYHLNQHIFESTDSGKSWVRISSDTSKLPNNFIFSPQWVGTDTGAIYAQNGGNANLGVCYWKPGMSGWKSIDAGLPALGNTLNFVSLKNRVLLSRMEHCLVFNGATNKWESFDKNGIANIPFSELYPVGEMCYSLQGRKLYSAHEWDKSFSSKVLNFVLDNYPFYSIRKTSTGFILVGTGAFGTSDFYASSDGNTWVKGGYGNSVPYAPLYSFGDSFWQYSSGVPILVESYGIDGKMNGTRNAGLYGVVNDSYMASMINHKGTIFGLISDIKRISSVLYKYNGTQWVKITDKINAAVFSGESLNSWNGKLLMGMANGKGVMQSDDDGKTWTDFSTGLSNLTPNVISACGDTVFIGTNKGVFMRTTSSSTWLRIHNNLPSNEVKKIEISEHYIWVLLDQGGIWRIPREGFSASLTQNEEANMLVWPNPAKNAIHFRATNGNKITKIEMYNWNGVLYFEKNVNGLSDVTVNIDVAQGLYFSVVHFANNQQAVSKIAIEP